MFDPQPTKVSLFKRIPTPQTAFEVDDALEVDASAFEDTFKEMCVSSKGRRL